MVFKGVKINLGRQADAQTDNGFAGSSGGGDLRHLPASAGAGAAERRDPWGWRLPHPLARPPVVRRQAVRKVFRTETVRARARPHVRIQGCPKRCPECTHQTQSVDRSGQLAFQGGACPSGRGTRRTARTRSDRDLSCRLREDEVLY